ncbi:MAG: 3TM-type holin [Alphaproteobacteria bacterium]
MSNLMKALVGADVTEPVKAIGEVFDQLFTSDEEKQQAAFVLEKLRGEPHLLQAMITKIEAQHRSFLVAGWRPFIGWVCGLSLAMFYLPQFAVATVLWVEQVNASGTLVPYPVSAEQIWEGVLALLGLGSLRTIEKLAGRAK